MTGKKVATEVREKIRQEYALGQSTLKELAGKYNIAYPTACKIVHEGAVPDEAKEADAFVKALDELERRFPGAIERIQKRVKFIPAKIEIVKY